MSGDGFPDLIISNAFDYAYYDTKDGTRIFKDRKPAPNQVILYYGTSFLLNLQWLS